MTNGKSSFCDVLIVNQLFNIFKYLYKQMIMHHSFKGNDNNIFFKQPISCHTVQVTQIFLLSFTFFTAFQNVQSFLNAPLIQGKSEYWRFLIHMKASHDISRCYQDFFKKHALSCMSDVTIEHVTDLRKIHSYWIFRKNR